MRLTIIAVLLLLTTSRRGFGGASATSKLMFYKPLMILHITHSITIMTYGCTNFRQFLVEGASRI